MYVQFGLLIVAVGFASWLLVVRKQIAAAKLKRKYLAGLLLVSGSAFNDQNPELYASALGEIANLMESGRLEPKEIRSRIQRALSTAEGTCSPEILRTANRLADDLASITAQSRRSDA